MALLTALAYLPGLGSASALPDEVVYLRVGAALVAGDATLNAEHPPLAKLLFGLAQEVVPDPLLAVRLVAVLAGVAILVGLHLLVARATGERHWGLAAAAAWAGLPHALRALDQPLGGFDKLDRYGMLDPVATAIAVLALVAAARWTDDRRLRWLVGAGALLGLAGAAKLPGLLFAPALGLVPLLVEDRRPRTVVLRWAVLGVAVVVGFLLPFTVVFGGDAIEALVRTFSLQADHRALGHPVVIRARAYDAAPWWAPWAYQWRDDGSVLTVVLTVSAIVGVVSTRAREDLRTVLVAAVVFPAIVVAAGALVLPHYRFLWLPQTVALAVLGIRALAGRGTLGRGAATVVVGVLVVVSALTVTHTATRGSTDYRAVAELLRDLDRRPATVLVHGYPRVLLFHAPHLEVVPELPADVVVLDPKVTGRRDIGDLEGRLRADGGYRVVEVDRLDVWIAEDR
ncbi:MAG: glycosyltransferase family 39 protein [Actinobacteria bacterium]|nr:glycosyltransferase family 39 protein [Actinomycetota bacterium]